MSIVIPVKPKPTAAESLQKRGALFISSTPEQRADWLDRTPWGVKLAWAEECEISLYMRGYHLPNGCALFREGDHDAFCAIVISGGLEILKGDLAEQQRVVAHLGVGKMVGEMSLLDGGSRSATAVAIEETDLLVLTREDFDRMSERHPQVALRFAVMIAEAIANLLRQTTGALVEHLHP
ncbi:MAG: cyclic nucleotide-binding domain-containing protein [Gemmatimonadaceae bacterium]